MKTLERYAWRNPWEISGMAPDPTPIPPNPPDPPKPPGGINKD